MTSVTALPAIVNAESVEGLRGELAAKQATIDALLRGFLPTEFPIVEGLAFDVLYRAAAEIEHLGGDWYDVFILPDGRVAFSLGDVCGRGLNAAVKMGQAKQAIKVAASLQINDPMPIPVLDQANKVIFLNNNHVEFTTAIYGIIDMHLRKVTYASAGHHPPILGKAGDEAQIMPNHGFALGVEVNLPDLIREHEFTIESGTMLVLYTDGLIEYSHDVQEGETRLLAAVRGAMDARASSPAKYIVENTLPGVPAHADDVAVLTIFFK